MNDNMQEYLAKTFQSKIWAMLGNTEKATQYADEAKHYYDNLSDSDKTKVNSFKNEYMPTVPLSPC